MHELLKTTNHRPWPLPASPWIMRQCWHDLLFAHWPLGPQVLAAKIPPPLELDVFDKRAWLAITPFHMSGVRMRGLPAVPGASAFPELNVRTYVTFRGKPGVWFFSLDAGRRLAVWGARLGFRLPYFYAQMTAAVNRDEVRYHSCRINGNAELKAGYAPTAAPSAEKTPLEHFLTERYCLYTFFGKKLMRADVHHAPWPLQPARGEFEINTMAAAAGIELSGPPQLLHFAKFLEVLIWPPQRAN